jgi:hypothetical protein
MVRITNPCQQHAPGVKGGGGGRHAALRGEQLEEFPAVD